MSKPLLAAAGLASVGIILCIPSLIAGIWAIAVSTPDAHVLGIAYISLPPIPGGMLVGWGLSKFLSLRKRREP